MKSGGLTGAIVLPQGREIEISSPGNDLSTKMDFLLKQCD